MQKWGSIQSTLLNLSKIYVHEKIQKILSSKPKSKISKHEIIMKTKDAQSNPLIR